MESVSFEGFVASRKKQHRARGELEDPVLRRAVVLPDVSERVVLAWWMATPRVPEHDEQ